MYISWAECEQKRGKNAKKIMQVLAEGSSKQYLHESDILELRRKWEQQKASKHDMPPLPSADPQIGSTTNQQLNTSQVLQTSPVSDEKKNEPRKSLKRSVTWSCTEEREFSKCNIIGIHFF